MATYTDPFTKEVQNLSPVAPVTPTSYTPGYAPAPVVAPPTSPNPVITGVSSPVIDTRTLISSTPKPGYIQGYDTQQGFAPVYVPKGTYVAGISATGKEMTPDKMSPVPGYTLPNGQAGTQADADRAIALAKANADATAKQKEADLATNPPLTPEQTKQQEILNSLADLAGQSTTALTEKADALKSPELAKLKEEQGFTDQKLGEVIAESEALDASYQKANEQAKQGVFSSALLQGKQQQIYRQYVLAKNELATRANVLRATSLGLQGRIKDAKDTITEAFDAKVAILNSQIANWTAQANAIQPTLTRQEQARLEEVKAKKEKEAQDAKDLSAAQTKAISDLYDAGVQVDSNTALEINKATSVDDVRNVMSKFGTQLARSGQLDIKYKEAQIQNVYSQMQERGGQATQYDPEEILAYARERASTGKSPTGAPKGSFGLIAQIAKELPKPEGSLVDINTGVKSTALSATQEDGILALYDISKKVKELKELDKKRVQGLLPAALGKVFGTEGQGDYIDLRDEIVDLLARARTGAALTSAEEEFYKSQLPGRVGQVGFVFGRNTQSKIDNFDKKINGTLNTRLQGQGTAIYGYSKVKVGDTEYKVGDIISNGEQQARVNPDGTLTIIQ